MDTTTNTIDRAQLFWDDSDPENAGWLLRFRNESGSMEDHWLDGGEDSSVEELTVFRGEQACGSLTIDGGRVVSWRAL